MKLLKLLIPFLLFYALLLPSCKPDEDICNDPYNSDCPNYDPCLLETEADASFRLEVRLIKNTSFFGDTTVWYPVEDTFFALSHGTRLYFKANSSKMDSYAWTIGGDPRTFTDSVFYLVFTPEEGQVGYVTAQLRVANDTLGDCLATSEQWDTFSRTFYIKDCSPIPGEENSYPMNGTFRGYVDGDSTEMDDMEIYLPGGSIYSFPGVDFGLVPAIIAPKEMWIFPDGSPRGYAKLQEDYKTLIMDYEVRQDDGSWESHQFVGERVE